MREAIDTVLGTEKTAADIIREARQQASKMLSDNDNRISREQKALKERQQAHFNSTVEQALSEREALLKAVSEENIQLNTDIDTIAESILNKVMQTVFDRGQAPE